jgi:hypothetical protein
MAKANMHDARRAKNDEFYTQFLDIDDEIDHYIDVLEGKVIYCNCDDPDISQFYAFFKDYFHELGLKRVIATCYKPVSLEDFGHGHEPAVCAVYDGHHEKRTNLQGNGDFRSYECIELLKEADVVITNPPFSLFREYLDQLIEYDKKFLIIGNINAITYRKVFSLIKNGDMWLGCNHISTFLLPNGRSKQVYCRWYTNLPNDKRTAKIELFAIYDEKEYPKYVNYDAINVDRVDRIPKDYYGVMGVPITFLDNHNPEQFEIIGIGVGKRFINLEGATGLPEKFVEDYFAGGGTGRYVPGHPILGYYRDDGKAHIPYARILIRRID